MEIDLRLLAIATIGKNLEKKLNTEEVKTAIRNGDVTYKFADYCKVSTGKSPKTTYRKDGEISELNTSEIIAEYCKHNGIDIVTETRENYKVTFTPSEKAHKEFNKMLSEVEDSQYRNIAKVANQLANIK